MRITLIAAALALSGCATTAYELTVMPRDSGKLYTGYAEHAGYNEGRVSVNIEGKDYRGSWVTMSPETTNGYVSGGIGYGRGRWGGGWGGFGVGTIISLDNPAGGASMALLNAPDGSGLRCEFRSSNGHGGGWCRDDSGRNYDVQLRPAPPRG
jgi:hypothetical protein